MTACLTKTDEDRIEETKERAREIADKSANEMLAIAKINQMEGVKIQSSHCNGATGSFKFYLLIELDENRKKIAAFVHRFPVV
ncbi:MAG: hypothetical protein WC467_01255 [Patescibacteria group bacterium]